MNPNIILCLVGGILVIGGIFLAQAIRIVPEYQRLVVFRLGRCVGEKGPGLIFLIPIIDRAVRVDLREQVREIPHQTAITKDNASISVDFIWYYKIAPSITVKITRISSVSLYPTLARFSCAYSSCAIKIH